MNQNILSYRQATIQKHKAERSTLVSEAGANNSSSGGAAGTYDPTSAETMSWMKAGHIIIFIILFLNTSGVKYT